MSKISAASRKYLPRNFIILHEDRDLIVIDKPPGLLTMATEREKERTAEFILTDYVRKGCAKSTKQVYVVHRLDRETSGVLIFAKSQEMKDRLQAGWPDVKKTYLAVVHGHCEKKADTLTSYLAENDSCFVYSTSDATRGKWAQTAYKVVKESKKYSLLEVDLLTGRKNQIRVHFSDMGHPIVGDDKYGKHASGDCPRLALHAKIISFNHPFTGRRLTFESAMPDLFCKLAGLCPPAKQA